MLAQVTVVWLLPVLGFSFSVASLKSSCLVVSSGFLFPAQAIRIDLRSRATRH